MNEKIFRDRIEIPLKLVIDVTDEPEGLTEATKAVLRRLVSENEGERALAEEDMLMAFIADSPGACTMTYGADSDDALDNLQEVGALSCEPHPQITNDAAEARMAAERDSMPNAHDDGSGASPDTVRRDVGLASEFVKGVEFALSLVRDSDACGVRESLAKCPETYRQARRESVQAIERWLKPNIGIGKTGAEGVA